MTDHSQILRVSAYVLLVEDAKILLCRLTAAAGAEGHWTLPGGGLEFGEHPEAAAKREVREETGFEVVLDELTAIDNHVFESANRDMQALRFIYRGHITGGELTHEAHGTTDLCQWVSLQESWRMPMVNLARFGMELAFPKNK